MPSSSEPIFIIASIPLHQMQLRLNALQIQIIHTLQLINIHTVSQLLIQLSLLLQF